jgi:phage internal scaffolding protein
MATNKVFIRTAHNYDTNAASNASGLGCQEPTRAQQHHKEECDINHIMYMFGKTGKVPVNALPATYGDFTHVVDYQTGLNALIASEAAFDALPSDLRKRFDNDPWELVQFLQNESNLDEAVELGLVNKKTGQIEPVSTNTDTPE